MKKCKNCGTKLAKDSAFCINCGTPVNAKKEKAAGEPKEKEKKKHPIRNFFLFIIFIALLGGGIYAYSSFIGFRSVKVEEWDGKVDLERGGRDKDIFEGLKLVTDDRVTTGNNANLMLLIDSDKELVASENTRFSIKATGITNNGKVTIKLEYGSALATIDKKLSEHSEFEITTPNATCSVRGTTFNVAYDQSAAKTRVDVTTGVVHVEAGKNSLDLNAGESAEVVDDNVKQVPNKPWTDRADILPSMKNGYVEFGAYEQDGDLMNGAEPIEWDILDSNENGTLLVSRYVLDAQPYNDSQKDVTWETSPLRSWLNADFIDNAFTEAEQKYINSVVIENPDNEKYEIKGGNETTDKVFLLGTEEILAYYEFNYYDNNREYGNSELLITEPTEYARQQGCEAQEITEDFLRENSYDVNTYRSFVGKTGTWWWLRSPGYKENMAICVSSLGATGWLNVAGNTVDVSRGVRPAIYIDKSFGDNESMATPVSEDDPENPDEDGDTTQPSEPEKKKLNEQKEEIEENPDFVPAGEDFDNSEVAGRWKNGNVPYFLDLNENGTCTLVSQGKDYYGTFHYTFDGTTVTFDIKTVIGSSLTFTGLQLRAPELESPYNLLTRY